MSRYKEFRCLVTGGRGLLGRSIKNLLMKNYAADNDIPNNKNSGCIGENIIKEVPKDTEELQFVFNGCLYKFVFLSSTTADLRNYQEVCKLMSFYLPHGLIHLAARVGGLFHNMKEQVTFLEDNVLINMNVVRAAKKYEISVGIFCLSTCVFPAGDQYLPLDETKLYLGPPHFSNECYSMAKRLMEMHVRHYRLSALEDEKEKKEVKEQEESKIINKNSDYLHNADNENSSYNTNFNTCHKNDKTAFDPSIYDESGNYEENNNSNKHNNNISNENNTTTTTTTTTTTATPTTTTTTTTDNNVFFEMKERRGGKKNNIGKNWICVSPTNLYGPHDQFNLFRSHVVPALIRRAHDSLRANTCMEVKGSGSALRQFLFAEDCAIVIIRLLFCLQTDDENGGNTKDNILEGEYHVKRKTDNNNKRKDQNENTTSHIQESTHHDDYLRWNQLTQDEKGMFIICGDDNDEYSIASVAEMIANSMGVTKGIKLDSSYPDGVHRKTASNARIRKFLGEKFAFTPLKEGIDVTCKWYIENYEHLDSNRK